MAIPRRITGEGSTWDSSGVFCFSRLKAGVAISLIKRGKGVWKMLPGGMCFSHKSIEGRINRLLANKVHGIQGEIS